MAIFKIQRTPAHTIIAHLSEIEGGVRLNQVQAEKGSLPVWEDLQGAVFPDRQAVRQTLIARMRAIARGEPQLTLLDRILLSTSAYHAWRRTAESVDPAILARIDPEDIPDEQAEKMPDGRLRIYVEYQHRILAEMFIPPDEWRWRDH